jgi:hypothetical protein
MSAEKRYFRDWKNIVTEDRLLLKSRACLNFVRMCNFTLHTNYERLLGSEADM